jgi:hypothetical protein
VFVGLTTLPSRITKLRPTVESLLAQTLLPDAVFISLPRHSVREDRSYDLPDWLERPPPPFQVLLLEHDYGPATKLLGCLPRISPDACLIVVDDDMHYKPFLVERLYESQVQRQDASFSFFVHGIGHLRVGQGADGFSFWTPNLTGIDAFAAVALQSPHLFLVDDLWISLFLQDRGIPLLSLQETLPDGELIYTATHRDDQLSDLPGDLAREIATREGLRFLLDGDLIGPRVRTSCALTLAAIEAT